MAESAKGSKAQAKLDSAILGLTWMQIGQYNPAFGPYNKRKDEKMTKFEQYQALKKSGKLKDLEKQLTKDANSLLREFLNKRQRSPERPGWRIHMELVESLAFLDILHRVNQP